MTLEERTEMLRGVGNVCFDVDPLK
jgi:hypothetical protein